MAIQALPVLAASFLAATEIALCTASQDALLSLSGINGLTTSFYRPS